MPAIQQGGLTLINPGDRDWTKHRYVLAFGYGRLRCMVWANDLDSALDECIDYIADEAPGLLADDEVNEEYQRLLDEYLAEHGSLPVPLDRRQLVLPCVKPYDICDMQEEVIQSLLLQAEVDTTSGGNCGNRIESESWYIIAEDPTREEVLELIND